MWRPPGAKGSDRGRLQTSRSRAGNIMLPNCMKGINSLPNRMKRLLQPRSLASRHSCLLQEQQPEQSLVSTAPASRLISLDVRVAVWPLANGDIASTASSRDPKCRPPEWLPSRQFYRQLYDDSVATVQDEGAMPLIVWVCRAMPTHSAHAYGPCGFSGRTRPEARAGQLDLS
eukprot:366374-Chlamydomonas_euryale.AAC.3